MSRSSKPAIREVEIADICMDGGIQPRSTLMPEIIADYREKWEDNAAFPPVQVIDDGEKLWLWDGFHRVASAVQAELTTILAAVRKGTFREAFKLSRGANYENSWPRTNSDKRRAVASVLHDAEWRVLEPQDIADICKVSREFVLKIMKEGELEVERPLFSPTVPIATPDRRAATRTATPVVRPADPIEAPKSTDFNSYVAHLREKHPDATVRVPTELGMVDVQTKTTIYKFLSHLTTFNLGKTIGDYILIRRFLDSALDIAIVYQSIEPMPKHVEMATQEGIRFIHWKGEAGR